MTFHVNIMFNAVYCNIENYMNFKISIHYETTN